MMDNGWDTGGWTVVWMVVSMAVMLAILWAIVAAVLRSWERPRRGPHDAPTTRGPKDVLADRFAKGEIDADEYRRRLRVLDDETAHPAGG